MTGTINQPVMAEEHIVSIISDKENGYMQFRPMTIEIKKGDTVTWVNEAKELHNMITYPDGFPKGSNGFFSPYLEEAGEKWSYTFNDIGTYQYHCVPHILMGMRGMVVVERKTNPNGFYKPTREEIAEYKDHILRFFDEEELVIMPDVVKRNIE